MTDTEELTQAANLVLARCAACNAEETDHNCLACEYNAAQNLAYKVLEQLTRPHQERSRKHL